MKTLEYKIEKETKQINDVPAETCFRLKSVRTYKGEKYDFEEINFTEEQYKLFVQSMKKLL